MVSVVELTGDQQHADNPASNHLKIHIRLYSHCTVATSRCLNKPIQSSCSSLPINLAIGQLDFGDDLASDFFSGAYVDSAVATKRTLDTLTLSLTVLLEFPKTPHLRGSAT